ncbi:MAG: hemerythrin domain-containing protein [Azonexus sp.]|jgi:hemerythrin-like domain-containing protein|nr:hemerythrin domain-containing protein [Azonexus sp.]
MKRSAALIPLSHQHHTVLSYTARIIRAATAADHEVLLAKFSAFLHNHLEPHFTEEERDLLPRLAAIGETQLVARTLDEHAQLRALATAIEGGDKAALTPFGTLLQAHVRFEERELFAVAEARLYSA